MYSLGEVNFIQEMHDLCNCKNSVVQQGRNNAPVLAIKIHQCKIAAKPRPPGVETPGYYLTSLSGLIVSCYKVSFRQAWIFITKTGALFLPCCSRAKAHSRQAKRKLAPMLVPRLCLGTFSWRLCRLLSS